MNKKRGDSLVALSQNVHMLITSTQHYVAVWRQRDIERARVKIRVPATRRGSCGVAVPGGASSSSPRPSVNTCVDWTPSGGVERLLKAGHLIQRGRGEQLQLYSGFTHNPHHLILDSVTSFQISWNLGT